MKKITASILTTLLMLSMVFSSSVFAANEETSAWDSFLGLFSAKASADDVGVEYRGHIQNVGDYPTDGSWIQGPERLGTVGKSLRLEAFWIKLTDAPEGLHIKYEVHVQNIGWMDPVEDGKLAGTQGDSLRIEAIKISLVDDEGNVSGDYTVTYKGHIQNVGDTAWIKSGQQLGTTGSGLRLEALEVKIEKIAPDLTDYEAALAAVTEANYTKASWAAYQDVVEDNVMTEDNVQSEVDAATAIILDAQEDLVTKAVVTSATAATQNTITLQGAALNKLAVADITVKNITVSSVVASADGTSATVTLASDLLADTDTAVAIKSDGDTSNFTVKFSIQAHTLAAVGGIFDKELKGQKVGLTLDGVAVTADYLKANGYTVEFRAWNAAGTVANSALFNTALEAVSATGILNEGGTAALTEGAYTVQVTARKGSTILTSEKVAVQVTDLVNEGSSILSYKMTQNTGLKTLNSTTLAVGEATLMTDVVVQYSSTNTQKLTNSTGGYLLSSSNKNVIAISGFTMTPVAPGTATVTIQVGTLTKAVAITVTQAERVPTTVNDSTQVNAIIAADGSITAAKTVTVLDQFGDPVVTTTPANLFVTANPTYLQVKYALTGSVDGLTAGTIVQETTAADKAAGKYSIPLTAAASAAPADGQISTMAFTNAAGTNVGSFTVKAVGNNSPYSQKIEYQTGSVNQSNTLSDSMVNMGEIYLVANNYNSSNVFVGKVASLENYTILYDPKMITVVDSAGTVDTDGTYTCAAATTYIKLTPVANAKGSTPIQIYKEVAQKNLVDSRTISVNAATPKITAVTFKTVTPKLGTTNYKDVLDVTTRVSEDPILNGVTLSENTGYDVCIDPTDNKTIYLDKDRNGSYTGASEKIGELVFTVHNNTGTAIQDPTTNTNQVVIGSGADGSFTFTVKDTTPTTTAPVIVNSQTVLVSLV